MQSVPALPRGIKPPGGRACSGRFLLPVRLGSEGLGHQQGAPSKLFGVLPGLHDLIKFHNGAAGRSKKPCIQPLLPPAL